MLSPSESPSPETEQPECGAQDGKAGRLGDLEVHTGFRSDEGGGWGTRGREASAVERELVRARVSRDQAVEERRHQIGRWNATIAAAAYEVLRDGDESPRAGRAVVATVRGIEAAEPRHQAFLQD